MITAELMLSLLMVLVAAWALGGLFSRFGLPDVLGQMLAGMILGPTVLVSALLVMAFIKTMMAPLTLKRASMRTCLSDEKSNVCRLWDENKWPQTIK